MKTDRKKAKRGKVLTYFENLEPGQSFFTELMPKVLTSYAGIYNRQIKTEICYVITDHRTNKPKIERITKVTIL
jgi:hypothetical protein